MAFSNDNLDVSLYFDLDNNRYRIQDNSPYTSASPAIAEADIRGVYSLTDPNSNVLHENADYDNPDVATSIDADLYSAYESFTAANGVYTLVYNAKDVDTSTVYTKTFTFTYAATVIPTVSIGIESNVGLATIESNDNTSYGATITLNSRSHVLTFPGSWGSTSTTGAQIALTELYTGQYSTTITSDITITGTDNLIIDIDITGTQTHDVWDSDGMYALREPLATFYDRWITAQTADPKEGRRLEYLWTEINANYALYNSAKQNGDLDTASTYLNNIKVILSAEGIDTTVDPSESVPVSSSLPGYATQWLDGSGVPADTLGRNGDYYIDTATNNYYQKTNGSWGSPIGVVGANTIIEFSANGTTGWTTTYTNGLNYIRFSGDGGVSYTAASKFIDGYVYIAYASDSSGTDFICTDDPSFVFNPVLEYRAEKKFTESHNGDLLATNFTGLFTKYRDNGIIAYSSTSSVAIITDADGNNPTFPVTNPMIYVYDGDTDVTASWTVAIDSTTNVTASVINDNEIDITGISADNGSITIICSRSGYDNLNVNILVSKVREGQAVIDITSVDDVTIGINGSSKAYVKDASVTGLKLDSSVADGSTIELSSNTLQVKDDGVTKEKIASDVAGDGLAQNVDGSLEVNPDNSTIEISGDAIRIKDEGVTKAKIDDSVRTSGKLYEGTMTLIPTTAEIVAILGAASTKDDGFQCWIKATAGTGAGYTYLINSYADVYLYTQMLLPT